MSDNKVHAELHAISARMEVDGASYADASRLLVLAEAAEALADEWHQKAIDIGSKMDISDADGAKAGFMMCTIQAYEACSKALSAAIAAALEGGSK